MTPQELPARLRRIAGTVQQRAALDAADAMAQSYQSSVVRSMRGPAPSPPGTPPARRSGTLVRSVRAEPAKGSGARATASVAPHTVYARIQQLGGHIHVVRAKVLTDGKRFYGRHVYLPKRPYMVMTPERREQVRRAGIAAVRRAVRAVIAGG